MPQLNKRQRRARKRDQREALKVEDFITRQFTGADWAQVPLSSQGWTTKPDRKRHFIARVRCVRFSDGTTRTFYLQMPKPETLRELRQLEDAVKELSREVRASLTTAIVNKERLLIRQPYRPRKKAKR
jgi:hypothetical protein